MFHGTFRHYPSPQTSEEHMAHPAFLCQPRQTHPHNHRIHTTTTTVVEAQSAVECKNDATCGKTTHHHASYSVCVLPPGPTRPLAEVERLDGEVDGGCLGDVEAVLEGADASVLLQEETAFHAAVMPVLEQKKQPFT